MLIFAAAFSILAFIGLLAFRLSYTPRYTDVQYRLAEEHVWKHTHYPLWLKSSETSGEVRMTMTLGQIHPTLFRLSYNGQITRLWVNGTPVSVQKDESFVDLTGVIHPGTNRVEVRFQTQKSPYILLLFGMEASTWNIFNRLMVLGFLSLALTWVVVAGSFTTTGKKYAWLPSVLALGIGLRTLYAATTPTWLRTYDWDGHLEYVLWMMSHWGIPEPQTGWEMFQPPLYYFLAALWLKVTTLFGFEYESIQALSLVLSIGTLFVGCFTVLLLFPEKKNRIVTLSGALFIAVFPGLLHLSGQASNDTLLVFLLFLSILFLVRWNTIGRLQDWILASVALAVALLTKSNALLLLPILYGILILQPSMSFREKCKLFFLSVGIIAALAGWLFILRFGYQGQGDIVANVNGLLPETSVPNDLKYYLYFNPLQVLRFPYLSDIAGPRREYLFEYLFRSAYFGHNSLYPLFLPRILLASGMSMLLLAIVGFVKSWREKNVRPVLLLASVLIFGLAAYRWTYPYAPDQHFRFIVPLALSFAVFSSLSLRFLHGRAQKLALILIQIHIVLITLFTIADYTSN